VKPKKKTGSKKPMPSRPASKKRASKRTAKKPTTKKATTANKAAGEYAHFVEAKSIENTDGQWLPVSMAGGQWWPSSVRIEAKSFWHIKKEPIKVYPDGSGAEGEPPPDKNKLVAPGLPSWSLIACWGSDRGLLTGWKYIGYGTTLDVPWPDPNDENTHTRAWLIYACNDDDRSDNHGWLHVYENFRN
jgi:hypothetical protein